MSLLNALLQGILQGITEFLPVSSSGHLSLYQYFCHLLNVDAPQSVFFSLMLHLGTLVAVVAVFYEDVWALIKEVFACIRDIFTGRFTFKTDNPQRKMLFMLVIATLPLVLVVFFSKWATGLSEDNDIVVEGVCFLITSVMLFFASRTRPSKAGIRQMKPQSALVIGVAQGVAVLPGISRSGATISTGLLLGFSREFMVKFSFLMSIPTILGGAVFEIGDAVKEGADVAFGPLALGILAAAVFGFLSINLLRKLVLSNKFVYFARYTFVLGIIVIITGVILHIIGVGQPADVVPQEATVADFLTKLNAIIQQAVASGAA